MPLQKCVERRWIPAEHDAPGVGGFGEQGIELRGEALGPGDDDRFDGLELECRLSHQPSEICVGSGEDADTPFFEKGRGAGETGNGVGAKLGGGGIGPEHGLLMVRTHDHGMGIHELPCLSRAFHGGRGH